MAAANHRAFSPASLSPTQVIAIGGGHGLSRLLQALKQQLNSFGAIVTTTDNGGSTGRLRADYGGIALGDLRHCLSALAEPEHLGKLLLDYRFNNGQPLGGHNLGNLMLLALQQLCICPSDAMHLLQQWLGVYQPLRPMSDHATELMAQYADHNQILGETAIDGYHHLPSQLHLHPKVPAAPSAAQLLTHCQAILVGPGSLLTSLCPTLLVPELQTIARDKPIGFLCNLQPEKGVIGALKPQQQVALFEHYCGLRVTAYLSHSHSKWPKPSGDLRHLSLPIADKQDHLHHPQRLADALPMLLARLNQ